MLTRRHLFYSGFATGCSMCASLVTGSLSHALAAQAVLPTEIDGPGHKLWIIGSLREAVMMGKRTILLDLRTLKDQPHLYGIGPIEGLAGEVTITNGRPALARVGAGEGLLEGRRWSMKVAETTGSLRRSLRARTKAGICASCNG